MPSEFRPLSPKDWGSLERLFGKRGASEGCWCMWWRQREDEFRKLHGESNRLAFKSLVESGTIPGLLAYQDGIAVGWCAIQPRECYSRLERSRVLARVDDQPVWSVTCFYVGRENRRQGLMSGLLTAAIDWAASNGAHIIEAYPMDLREGARVSAAYMGVVPVFLKAGFAEVARRSQRRPIMRRSV